MGDLFSAKANSEGKFQDWFFDKYLNMYEYNTINGNSVSVHFPMRNQLDYDEDDINYRLSSLGIIGRNVNDWTPHQDLGP
jgi:Cu/Zn superoxide dismutase